MHTILGANGTIARELSRALASFTVDIRQVSRSPHKVNPNDETVAADLLDGQATANAVYGSDVVYLVTVKSDHQIYFSIANRFLVPAPEIARLYSEFAVKPFLVSGSYPGLGTNFLFSM